MKKRFATLTSMIRLIVGVFLFILCAATFAAPETKPQATANDTNRFEVTGMTCNSCVKGLTSELRRVPGVASVSVTLTNKLAVVSFDTNRVSTPKLVAAIKEAGYKAKLQP